MTWPARLMTMLGLVLCSCGGGDGTVSSSTYAATTEAVEGSGSSGSVADTTADATGGSGEGDSSGAPGELQIDCADPPETAVGAEYDHMPIAIGAVSTVSWSMTGLPTGMQSDPITGRISGASDEAGSFDVEITATSLDQIAHQSCTVVVGDALVIDLSGHTRPCIAPGDDITMFVQGGTDSALHCTPGNGSGSGEVPDGVTVDAETCMIQGSIREGYGTWVWITGVEQNGYTVNVPYCMTQDVPPPGSYAISGDHSGMTDNALDPAVFSFAPDAPISFGGMGDPIFRVEGPCGPSSCYYGYLFGIGSSPFAGDSIALGPTATLHDIDDNPIGFTHELSATAASVPEWLAHQPWVLQLHFRYCIADNATDCSDGDAIGANGNGSLRFGLIALPEP